MSYEMKEFTLNKDEYIESLREKIGGYKSPVEIIMGQIETTLEEDVLKAVQNYEIVVDKDKLLKALKYDREQYDKGYADGLSEICEEKDAEIQRLKKQLEDRPGFPGEWKYCGSESFDIWRCSRCKQITLKQYNYCPHCGTRMVWDE